MWGDDNADVDVDVVIDVDVGVDVGVDFNHDHDDADANDDDADKDFNTSCGGTSKDTVLRSTCWIQVIGQIQYSATFFSTFLSFSTFLFFF